VPSETGKFRANISCPIHKAGCLALRLGGSNPVRWAAKSHSNESVTSKQLELKRLLAECDLDISVLKAINAWAELRSASIKHVGRTHQYSPRRPAVWSLTVQLEYPLL